MTKEHKLFLKKVKRRSLTIKILQFGILIMMILAWELLANAKWIDPYLTSSPSRILKTIDMLYQSNQLFLHLSVTFYETVVGFLLSTVIGTIIALVLWSSEIVRKVLEPYLIVLNALPKVALGPLIIIWVGIGQEAIITMALLICVIITIISMLTGFLAVDKDKILLLQSMKANKLQILLKVVFPYNIPTLMSVLKINVGLAWVGTIMGEYLVSKSGIGYLINNASANMNLDTVMTCTLLLCALASIMYVAVQLLEKFIIKRF